MSQPLFKLRKELSTPVPEDVNGSEERGSFVGTADSSLPDASSGSKFTNQIVLTENDKYVVSQLGPQFSFLPEQEGQEVVGSVDCNSGNALSNDGENLYVWSFDSPQRVPNYIRIGLGSEMSDVEQPAKCCFTWPPAGDDSNVAAAAGILIVYHSGLVKFYEDINTINGVSTLLTKSKVIELNLKLKEQEYVSEVVNAEPSGVLISTGFGRLLLITIRDNSGKPRLELKQQLVKSQIGYFSSKMNARKRIVSIRPGPITGKGERLAYTVTGDGEFKIWNISATMNCYKRIEVNVYDQILESLQDLYPFAHGSLQILDTHQLPLDPSAHIVLASISDGKLAYYISTTIKFEEATNSFSIMSVYRLNTYVRHNSKNPRIFIPSALEYDTPLGSESAIIYFLFEDAIVISQTSMKLDSNYPLRRRWEDIISLRNDVNIVGYGYDTQALYLINGRNGLLKIESRQQEEDQPEISFIKSHIDQAVYFSKLVKNPIEFNLPESIELENEEIEKDLLLSGKEILLSESIYIPPKLSPLTRHLQVRIELFENLLLFTKENFNYKVSPKVKLTLIEYFEIMKCTSSLYSVLPKHPDFNEIWEQTLRSGGVDGEQLTLKKLNEFPEILGHFLSNLNELLRTSSSPQLRESATQLVISIIYQACLEQGENEYRYGKLNLAATEVNTDLPWFIKFSIPISIHQILLHFVYAYEDTAALTKHDNILLDFIKTLYYLCKQAAVWQQNGAKGKSEECDIIEDFYHTNHLLWIQILVKVARANDALQIADFYQDFGGLVEALNSLTKQQSQPLYDKFFSKYGFVFAQTVFTTFIEQGKIHDLFFQFSNYHDYLCQFFESNPQYDYVSWIGNIFDDKYEAAAIRLKTVAASKQPGNFSLNQRQVQLSVAKLSALMVDTDDKVNVISEIQSNLDLIDAQKMLLADIDNFHDSVIKTTKKGSEIRNYYEQLISRVKEQHLLTAPEVVFLLSAVAIDDSMFHALRLISLDKTLSDADRGLLHDFVWRRCVLQDKWDDNSNEMESTLYLTLLKLFRAGMFKCGVPLPDYSLLISGNNIASLSKLLFNQHNDIARLEASLKDEVQRCASIPKDMNSEIQSLVGAANQETGSNCVINYKTNTIE